MVRGSGVWGPKRLAEGAQPPREAEEQLVCLFLASRIYGRASQWALESFDLVVDLAPPLSSCMTWDKLQSFANLDFFICIIGSCFENQMTDKAPIQDQVRSSHQNSVIIIIDAIILLGTLRVSFLPSERPQDDGIFLLGWGLGIESHKDMGFPRPWMKPNKIG